MVNVEVVVATNEKQTIVSLCVPKGTNVKTVIELSGLLTAFTNLPSLADFAAQGFSVGIFSKKVSFETVVQENDRVEIYFPLKQSAIDARKARAKSKNNKA